jgi:hypothetical protein
VSHIQYAKQALAELEAALVKAEKTMNQLKCKIAEECQAVRCDRAAIEP